jgi:hypothetical protein
VVQRLGGLGVAFFSVEEEMEVGLGENEHTARHPEAIILKG